MRKLPADCLHRQKGAVLIVALVLLLVLTVLGTATMRDTTMEERMAGNFRDVSVALQAAEAALSRGEGAVAIASTHGTMAWDGSDGSYIVNENTLSIDPDVTGNYGFSVTASDLLLQSDPVYMVEQLPAIKLPGSDLAIGTQNQPPSINYFRISASGSGVSPHANAILQTTHFNQFSWSN